MSGMNCKLERLVGGSPCPRCICDNCKMEDCVCGEENWRVSDSSPTAGSTSNLETFVAPLGFEILEKSEVSANHDDNICRHCDARKRCQENKDDWCKLNPCMSHRRSDGKGVVFIKSSAPRQDRRESTCPARDC